MQPRSNSNLFKESSGEEWEVKDHPRHQQWQHQHLGEELRQQHKYRQQYKYRQYNRHNNNNKPPLKGEQTRTASGRSYGN